jgi:hypothetical protein
MNSFVVGWRIILGEVVPKVLCGGSPSYIELILKCAIAHPVEMHVGCFAVLPFTRVLQYIVHGCSIRL